MELADSPLFAGLTPRGWRYVLGRMKARSFVAGEYVCREGDTSDRLHLIEDGVVEVIVGEGASAQLIRHLRRGDILGEMGLLSGEPRSASVRAALPTRTLELDRSAFADIIHRYPNVVLNISRVLVERQRRSLRWLSPRRRDNFILLMIGRRTERLAQELIELCRQASPHGATIVDLTDVLELPNMVPPHSTAAAAIAILDQMIDAPSPIICVCHSDQPDLALLVHYMDRLTLLGTASDIDAVATACAGPRHPVEVFLIGPKGAFAKDKLLIVRRLDASGDGSDLGWIARHLTRTKLGLALGAGGAKGFAHVGVLSVLQRAGYAVDYVAGSSIGGLIGGLMGLGMDADAIDRQLRRVWSPEHVDLLADLSQEGLSAGLERAFATIKDIFGDRLMSELSPPLRILAADLEEGEPVLLDDFMVCEAVRAGLTIPGLAPPYRNGPQRLVDAVCLAPVPASFVRDMGADIVVAVNLLSRPALSAWPSEAPPMPARRMTAARDVDPVIETLMMLQINTSLRNASKADIVLTPRFTVASWRDFYLAEQFRDAGAAVAEACLARLSEVARPAARRERES
jgi:NTE family protein